MDLFNWVNEDEKIKKEVKKAFSLILLVLFFLTLSLIFGVVGGVLGWILFAVCIIATLVSGGMFFYQVGENILD